MFDQVLKRLYKQPLKGVVNWKTKSCKFRTLTINPSVNNGFCRQRLTNLLNTSQRLVNKINLTWWYVFKTSWKCLQDVFARRLEDVLKRSCKRLEDVWTRGIYWSWPRRFEDVLKTSCEDVWLMRIYSSSRRLHQDECLLGLSYKVIFLHNKKLKTKM